MKEQAQLDRVVAELRKRLWLGDGDLPGYRIPLAVEVTDDRGDRAIDLLELPPVPAPR